jgi:hypothetical protein
MRLDKDTHTQIQVQPPRQFTLNDIINTVAYVVNLNINDPITFLQFCLMMLMQRQSSTSTNTNTYTYTYQHE